MNIEHEAKKYLIKQADQGLLTPLSQQKKPVKGVSNTPVVKNVAPVPRGVNNTPNMAPQKYKDGTYFYNQNGRPVMVEVVNGMLTSGTPQQYQKAQQAKKVRQQPATYATVGATPHHTPQTAQPASLATPKTQPTSSVTPTAAQPADTEPLYGRKYNLAFAKSPQEQWNQALTNTVQQDIADNVSKGPMPTKTFQAVQRNRYGYTQWDQMKALRDKTYQQEMDRLNKSDQVSSQRFAALKPRKRHSYEDHEDYKAYLSYVSAAQDAKTRNSLDPLGRMGGYIPWMQTKKIEFPKFRSRRKGQSQFAYQDARREYEELKRQAESGTAWGTTKSLARGDFKGAWKGIKDAAGDAFKPYNNVQGGDLVQGFNTGFAIDQKLAEMVQKGLATPEQRAQYNRQLQQQKVINETRNLARSHYAESVAASKWLSKGTRATSTILGTAAGAAAKVGMYAYPAVGAFKFLKGVPAAFRIGKGVWTGMRAAGGLRPYATAAFTAAKNRIANAGVKGSLKYLGSKSWDLGGQIAINDAGQGLVNGVYQATLNPNASLQDKQNAYQTKRNWQKATGFGTSLANAANAYFLARRGWGGALAAFVTPALFGGFPGADKGDRYIPTLQEAVNNPQAMANAMAAKGVGPQYNPYAEMQARQGMQNRSALGRFTQGFTNNANIWQNLFWNIAPNAMQAKFLTQTVTAPVVAGWYDDDPNNMQARGKGIISTFNLQDPVASKQYLNDAYKLYSSLYNSGLPQSDINKYVGVMQKIYQNKPLNYGQRQRLQQLEKISPQSTASLKQRMEWTQDSLNAFGAAPLDKNRNTLVNNIARGYMLSHPQELKEEASQTVFDTLAKADDIVRQKDPKKQEEMIKKLAQPKWYNASSVKGKLAQLFGNNVSGDVLDAALIRGTPQSIAQWRDTIVEAINSRNYTGQQLIQLVPVLQRVAAHSKNPQTYAMTNMIKQVASKALATNQDKLVKAVDNIKDKDQYMSTVRDLAQAAGGSPSYADTTKIEKAIANKGKQIFIQSENKIETAKELAQIAGSSGAGQSKAGKQLTSYMMPYLARQGLQDFRKWGDIMSIFFYSKGWNTAAKASQNPYIFYPAAASIVTPAVMYLGSKIRGMGTRQPAPAESMQAQTPYAAPGLPQY